MPIKTKAYVRPDGASPFEDWFSGLSGQAAFKVATARARLELGNLSNVKWFSGIGEYVIDWGPGYRIYLAEDGKDLIVLLNGGTKKGQQSAINWARTLHKEYKARKAAAAASRKSVVKRNPAGKKGK